MNSARDDDRRLWPRVVIAALMLFLAVPPLIRWTNSLSVRTVKATYGTFTDTRTVAALLVRDETMLTASATGRLTRLVDEERRVRAGTVVASIDTPAGEELIRAPRPGVIRFHWDGWQGPSDVAALMQQRVSFWDVDEGAGGHVNDGDEVARGEPVARLVDSHTTRLLVDVPADAGWRVGDTVTVMFDPGGQDAFSARITALAPTTDGEATVALLEVQRYLAYLDASRRIDVRLTLARHEGVTLPVEALVWDDGRPGVFVRDDDDGVIFETVTVAGRTDDIIVINGVKEGREIVVNPERIRLR